MEQVLIMSQSELNALIDERSAKIIADFKKQQDNDRLINAKEVMQLFGVKSVSLWKWQRKGIITPLPRSGEKGKRMYKFSDVQKIMLRHQKGAHI
ncbi:MAG TPA: hypothetical protein VIH86_06490 [Puia sp.]